MAQRKLQQEIDRVFKRISEGVTAFDALYDKLMSTNNQSQKEKLEQDLKREIKKLQRLRDQIKTWMGSNDIKDKKALSDQRKLIETQMERFKACEKEMKTKAYSKEGLTASTKLDPKEKEKQEMANFVQGMIEELDRQVESAEAEVESIRATMKKGKKDSSKTEKISEIDLNIERHKWHQSKLELILRMLENGNIQPEQVQNIQDDIRYYVESNQDADFAEDDEIYDELNLDNDDDIFGMTADGEHHHEDDELSRDAATVPTTTTTTTTTASLSPPPPPPPPPPLTGPTPSSKKEISRKPSGTSSTSTTTTVPTPSLAATKSPIVNHSQISSSSIPGISNPSMKPASLPTRPAGDMKYVAAAAASSSSSNSTNTLLQQQIAPGIAPLPPAPVQKVTNNNSSSNHVSPKGESKGNKQESPKKESSTILESSNEEIKGKNTPPPAPTELNSTAVVGEEEDDEKPLIPGTIFELPPGLKDLITSFEAAKKRIDDPPPIETIGDLLNSSLMHCPDSFDADKPKHYQPKTPYPTPSYYPQEPLTIFDDINLYEKLDLDTLFYVFYYRQGSYQQYLTARELKRQSWRYHKRFLTWFQRHEEPKSITDEFEQGTYRYFDFEGLWLQRRKTNFQFEYQYLEDEV